MHTCWRTTATGVAAAVTSGVDARIDAPSSTKTGAVGPQHVATMLGFWPRVHRSTTRQAIVGGTNLYQLQLLNMRLNTSLKI